MQISEDRISHIAHLVMDKLWRDDLADFPEENRALQTIKNSITAYFSIADEIDEAVRKKLSSYGQSKVPGSREWEVLYRKFSEEEVARRK